MGLRNFFNKVRGCLHYCGRGTLNLKRMEGDWSGNIIENEKI